MSLPSPELVNYYRLAENRIFYIDYEIDESVLEVQKAIIIIILLIKIFLFLRENQLLSY